MSIGRAEKRGNLVFVHDDEGQLRFVRLGDLHGQTRTTVSILRTGIITTFDETGHVIEEALLIGDDVAPARQRLRQASGSR